MNRMLIETPELDKIVLPEWMRVVKYTPKQQAEIGELLEKHVWITAARRKMDVVEMTTYHIKNCIRCWEGLGNKRIPHDYLGGKEKWLKIFNDELLRRS